ncbi:MAG TPA: S8 family serine peptidase [Thermoanaerobaculaceae bacterium]|nr:S8 family serine peptidase [Thermoanaerobaculaceae bacterium]
MSIRFRRSFLIIISAVCMVLGARSEAASSRLQLVKGGKGGPPARTAATAKGAGAARLALVRRGYTVNADGRVGAMVEMSEPSAVEVYLQAQRAGVAGSGTAAAASVEVQASALARAQMARLDQAQRDLAEVLTSPGIGADVIYRVQRVYNGVAVQVDPARLDEIGRLPGVKAVHPLVPKRRENFTSVPFIGAPQVWGGVAGGPITGAGVKVGVIDTGIDYLHKDFGGSGAYRGDGTYTSANWPKTAKVVGGYDFCGDNYDASGVDGSTTPVPDPDPMDCFGLDSSGNAIITHGSHVAGTLAGYGENADGSTFAGPWNASTPISTLGMGPGVAPGAQLYALRIFGCGGVSNLVTPALDWAVDPNNDGNFSDHLDVVNLSLGSSYGAPDDPDAQAAERAASLGVIVVAAAGNDNDGYFIVGTPSNATRAISVAAVGDPGVLYPDLVVNTPDAIAGDYVVEAAEFGPPLPSAGITSDLVWANPHNGCSSFSNAAAMQGKVAMMDRGSCNFTVKVKNAQLAGATAAIVADNVDEGPIVMSGTDATITIPSVSMFFVDAQGLEADLPTPGVNVTLTGLLMTDAMASFSSRGPRTGDALLKPDVAAPGLQIFSVEGGSTNQGIVLDGTSMATPHVAGTMALLRQLHPDWSVEELKALLMNTGHDVTIYPNATPPLVGPGRIGAGRVDVAAAAQAPGVAFCADDAGAVSVSFGAVEVSGTTALTKHVTVENKSAAAVTYAVGYAPFATVPGVSISFPLGDSVTVPAGGSAEVDVLLTATAANMRHTMDPSVFTTSEGFARFWLSEEDGYLTLTPASGPVLRVPVYATLRPVSAMSALQTSLGVPGSPAAATLDLVGKGISTGTAYPNDILSLVSAFELVEDNPDPSVSDARFLGVATDYATQVANGKALADSTIYFGIAMQQNWSNPVPVVYDILIDTNGDGKDDYDLFITDFDPGDDVYEAALCSLSTNICSLLPANGVTPDVLDTAPLDSNVVVLPVSANALGLGAGKSQFKFYFNRATGAQVHHSYDPTSAGLTFGGSFAVSGSGQPIFPDLPTTSIQVSGNQASYTTDGASGILLLHHHNGAGARAQTIAAEFGACTVSATASGPATVAVNSAAAFQATATGSSCSGSATYTWDFGDGTPFSSNQNPSHTYAVGGTYAWRLLASFGDFSTTRTGTITVTDPRTTKPRRHLNT